MNKLIYEFIIGIGSCNFGVKKSHDLPSARGRTKKVGGMIQYETKGPTTRSP